MPWLRAHPYIAALCAAGVLLIVGTLVVERKASRPTETRVTAWGGGVVPLLNPTSYEPAQNTQDEGAIARQVTSGPPYTYIPPNLTIPAPTSTEGAYDFEAFIAMLTKASAPQTQTTVSEDSAISSAYAYIPRGLISMTSPTTARTDIQRALYEYGNDVGSSIESFEQQHANMVQALKEQAEDRADKGKADAVIRLGHALQDMGNSLAAMDAVPSVMASAHQALAQSYVEIGKNLSRIPQAERDSDFIQAIQTYNASADTFTKNYIQIVSLFGVYGVSFTSIDAGRVFMFSRGGF